MAKALAKKKSADIEVTKINGMFAADAGVGVNNLGSEDLAIPFIKVLQKMSDELDDLDKAKPGDIYNTVTKDVIKGKDGIRLINCAYNLQYIEWEPRGTGTGAPHAIYGAGDEYLQLNAVMTIRIMLSRVTVAILSAQPSITFSSLTKTA